MLAQYRRKNVSKKLIEVALPLEAINREAAREKSIRHGHPSTLHLWWARRPLAACRAVLFASLVDDPSSHPEAFPTEEAQEQERARLFRLIEDLVKWENINNERVLEAARREILQSTNGNPPPVMDPFCGGGSIPLEAQRLGLKAYASDLNPVAVLITKALIEIPPRFAGQPPVHLGARTSRLSPGDLPLGARASRPHHQSRGYYSRGYLPHFDQPGLVQMITFRLHDAMPASRRAEWENMLNLEDELERCKKIEEYLDAGYGSCVLRDERIARLVQEALLHFDGQRYRLLAWVIMPNHVHVLIETRPGYQLSEIVQAWKSFTAKEVNKLLGRRGILWQTDYFDRFIRDEQHFENAVHYIHYNPVKAGLVTQAEDWPYSSVSRQEKAGGTPALPGGERCDLSEGETPVLPGSESRWIGAHGLAADVRYYGQWMREEAERRIGHLYPKVRVSGSVFSGNAVSGSAVPGSAGVSPAKTTEATVIAWLWARTVQCPNPACGAQMPLVRSFWLSTKKGKKAWVEPIVDKVAKTVRFEVKMGSGVPPEGTVNRRGTRCIVCGQAVPFDHVRAEGKAGRMSTQLMAIVAEGENGRVYLSPSEEHAAVAVKAKPMWAPDTSLPEQALGFRVQLYGMTKHSDLFTPRQLVALTTFSDLVSKVRDQVLQDALTAGLADDGISLNDGGSGATAYADAVATYLGLAVDRLADRNSVICSWDVTRDNVRNTFARQAIPMTWDFAEANPLSDSTGNFQGAVEWVAKVVENSPYHTSGIAKQLDATTAISNATHSLISTDPPYYDNIGYADLSDFFYVWLRRSLAKIYPGLFNTLLTPKAQELVATPYRFGGDREKAEDHFLTGLRKAFHLMQSLTYKDYPMTVYYAFKQSEQDESDGDDNAIIASTGWETMLEGLLTAGFQITGTLPMRTELSNRTVASGTNALASSIVLVCRPRPENAPLVTRREFINALRRELPDALRKLQHGNIAPVDFAQAAIGPGMAVFSRYAKVVEADGTPMRVRAALALINQTLDEVLAEQEGEFDADTRWALAWFEQFAFGEGPFGDAETLSKAKNTSVQGMVEAGILMARAGKVRLLRREELRADWDPESDPRLTVWEVTQYLIRALDQVGEEGTATLLRKVGGKGEEARDLAYRLYNICDRKNWAQEALAYNSLVIAWPEVTKLASRLSTSEQQTPLFE